MKKSVLLSFLTTGLLLCSCRTYIASYSVDLTAVESPADATIQFGETKVASFKDIIKEKKKKEEVEVQVKKYRYEDDFIDIVWYVSSTDFNFTLKNKSNHTIKINWDDISYVDYEGKAGRVMHSGVKYSDRNNIQPASTIPKNSSLSDILVPTENVYFNSGEYGGLGKKLLIPSIYQNPDDFASSANTYVGKTMKVLMPIVIENVQNDYTFEFSITSLLNPELGNNSKESNSIISWQ